MLREDFKDWHIQRTDLTFGSYHGTRTWSSLVPRKLNVIGLLKSILLQARSTNSSKFCRGRGFLDASLIHPVSEFVNNFGGQCFDLSCFYHPIVFWDFLAKVQKDHMIFVGGNQNPEGHVRLAESVRSFRELLSRNPIKIQKSLLDYAEQCIELVDRGDMVVEEGAGRFKILSLSKSLQSSLKKELARSDAGDTWMVNTGWGLAATNVYVGRSGKQSLNVWSGRFSYCIPSDHAVDLVLEDFDQKISTHSGRKLTVNSRIFLCIPNCIVTVLFRDALAKRFGLNPKNIVLLDVFFGWHPYASMIYFLTDSNESVAWIYMADDGLMQFALRRND